MSYDINSQQVDIENLFKQNELDLCSIKELYRKLKELEKKITQIKYIDSKLADKLKKDYETLRRVIVDENVQVQLLDKINENKIQLQEGINEINLQLQNYINEINTQLDNNENELSIKNRKIDYLFSATLWQFSYDGGTHPSTPEQITSQLEKMKYLGFDGIVVIARLIINSENNLDFDIPLSSILWYITETQRLNMNVRAIKVHMSDNYFSTINNIEEKYTSKVMELANAVKNYNIPYFVVYNEAVNYLYNANSSSIASINSLCNNLRILGFKVGISGLSFKKIYELQWLNDCQDVMFPFAYTRISDKGKHTTIADSLFAYKEQLKKYSYYKEKINKPIIISETGILPYWGAFANPVYFDWNDNEPIDNSGEIQKIFFYGLFETVEFNDIIDECWVWFPDNMTDGNALENCSKFIKRYTQGVK